MNKVQGSFIYHCTGLSDEMLWSLFTNKFQCLNEPKERSRQDHDHDDDDLADGFCSLRRNVWAL